MPSPPTPPTVLFGMTWPKGMSAFDVCVHCIRKGGIPHGSPTGPVATSARNLFTAYRTFQSLLWPGDSHNPWSDLMLQSLVKERITVVMGPKDCGKTRTIAKFALTDYFCFPQETLCLVSSTTLQGLELRVWGDIKSLFDRAKQQWAQAPGNALESRRGIFTDSIDSRGEVRDQRKGLICIAMRDANGQWVGLQQYCGIKQKRRRIFADELQFYKDSYLTVLANLDKGDFKGGFVGNPLGELDPLDKMAEPVNGWESEPEPTKTTTWRNRWGGQTINLVGSDSPAIHTPGRYMDSAGHDYLIVQSDIDRIVKRFGENSFEYWNQAMGIRKPGAWSDRVFTRDMALQFGSFDTPFWNTKPRTKVYGLDAGYGGDRCVGLIVEFGWDVNGHPIIAFSEPRLVPVTVFTAATPQKDRMLPEDQIANRVMKDCVAENIPPDNVFFDATGRGSLGTSFARVWSAAVNPIEFGGSPTDRPVCNDLYTVDPKTGHRRLKTAKEHYSKFVTELHYSLRYAGEGRQLRSLPESVLEELSRRRWKIVTGDRRELESKQKYKDTYGTSPDLADAAVIALEGARRRGFPLVRLENPERQEEDSQWRRALQNRAARLHRSYALDYAC